MSTTLRLGTRASQLAVAQSRLVADSIRRVHPRLNIEVVTISSEGDRILDRPLHEFGGKGLFTRNIEQALLDDKIDIAVHSFKDLPVTEPLLDTSALVIAATPKRADPRDALVTLSGAPIQTLPAGATVGTSSLRRRLQLIHARPDLTTVDIRGNIDTRLRKLEQPGLAAILLAVAGLQRAGLWDDRRMVPLSPSVMLPAAGQGALAVQCRRDDAQLRQMLVSIDDPITAMCVTLERAVVEALGGDCHSAIGALVTIDRENIHIQGMVGWPLEQPQRVVRAEVKGTARDPLVWQLVQLLQR